MMKIMCVVSLLVRLINKLFEVKYMFSASINNGVHGDVVISTAPVIVLDYITDVSGSKTYITQGRELYILNLSYVNTIYEHPSEITVSGSSVTWSGVSQDQPFFVLLR